MILLPLSSAPAVLSNQGMIHVHPLRYIILFYPPVRPDDQAVRFETSAKWMRDLLKGAGFDAVALPFIPMELLQITDPQTVVLYTGFGEVAQVNGTVEEPAIPNGAQQTPVSDLVASNVTFIADMCLKVDSMFLHFGDCWVFMNPPAYVGYNPFLTVAFVKLVLARQPFSLSNAVQAAVRELGRVIGDENPENVPCPDITISP